jgi:hypothetical protein
MKLKELLRLDELRFQMRDGRPLKVFKNLTWPKLKEFTDRVQNHEIRGYVVSDTEILWWDGYLATHHDITVQLGMEYMDWRRLYILRPVLDNGITYELRVSNEIWRQPGRLFHNPVMANLCKNNSELMLFYSNEYPTGASDYIPIDQALEQIFSDDK